MRSSVSLTEGPPAVLAAGVRSPWVKAGGRFQHEDAGHLGARVARELLDRSGVDPAQLDEVIVGCVGPPHDQANIARVIALRAGVPWPVPARTVARNCASGIEAVTSALTSIQAGQGDLYLCMGIEVMSAYPLIFGKKMTGFFADLMKARSFGRKLSTFATFRPSFLAPRIALMEGLTDPTNGLIMGKTAEVLARDFGITRADSDRFALESHQRARQARDQKRFDREVVPVLPLDARKDQGSVEYDDGIRDNQSMEMLAKLKPFFEKPDGIVTVGSSSQVTDGASALLIASQKKAHELGLQPLAKFRSFAWSGCDPSRMGLGPVFSTASALDAAGLRMSDIDIVELNEAFAAQVIACERAFDSRAFAEKHLGRSEPIGQLDMRRTNVNGGAIALGHPVGATGARLLLTTAHELHVSDLQLGLATLCIGGGQGGAVVLERMAA